MVNEGTSEHSAGTHVVIFHHWATVTCISCVICRYLSVDKVFAMTLYSPISSIYCSSLFCWPHICCRQHIVSFCFTLINVNTRLDVPHKHSHFHTGVALSERNKEVSRQVIFHLNNTSRTRNCLFPPSCWLLDFDFYCVVSLLLAFEIRLREMKCGHWGEGTNRQWLQMEFGQWSEIPIQKIDRTLFTNWSLKFQRGESHKCYIRSQRSFDF